MAEEEIMMDDTSIAIDDVAEEGGQDETKSYNIIPFIMDRYKKADDYREQDEQRWLRAYRNYRGLYGSDVQFTEAEKSRVFIKVTKTKTLAAYGQIIDVLFANNKFPLTVEPTTLPEGVASDVSFDPQEPESIRTKLDENDIQMMNNTIDNQQISMEISVDKQEEDDSEDGHEEDDSEEEVDESNNQVEELSKELEEAYATVKELKKTINEVNLLNAKLLYANKLFRSYAMNNDQKSKVVETLDRTKSVREVKLVFATLAESMKFGGETKKVRVTEGIASKPQASTAPKKEIISESNEIANRFKKLANIK